MAAEQKIVKFGKKSVTFSLSRRTLRKAYRQHGFEMAFVDMRALGFGILSKLAWVAQLADAGMSEDQLYDLFDAYEEAEGEVINYILATVPNVLSVLKSAEESAEGKGTEA